VIFPPVLYVRLSLCFYTMWVEQQQASTSQTLLDWACAVQEPYRLKLLVMRHRLEQNLRIVNARLRELGEADQVRTC
jgi:phosphoenolpyruvate carboxylase